MNLNNVLARRGLVRTAALSVALLLAPGALAQEAPAEPATGTSARTLDGLEVGTTEGGAVRITMTLSQPAPEPVPYPERHVRYAETICQLLRSLLQREHMLDDCTPAQRHRLQNALHDATSLLGQVRAKLGT